MHDKTAGCADCRVLTVGDISGSLVLCYDVRLRVQMKSLSIRARACQMLCSAAGCSRAAGTTIYKYLRSTTCTCWRAGDACICTSTHVAEIELLLLSLVVAVAVRHGCGVLAAVESGLCMFADCLPPHARASISGYGSWFRCVWDCNFRVHSSCKSSKI